MPPEDIVEYTEARLQSSDGEPPDEEAMLDWDATRLELLAQFEGWQKASLAAAMLEAEEFMEIMSEQDARWIAGQVQRQFEAAASSELVAGGAALFRKTLEMSAASHSKHGFGSGRRDTC